MVALILPVTEIANFVIPVLLYLVVTVFALVIGNKLVVYGYLSEILAPRAVPLRYAQNAMLFILRETARHRHPALAVLLFLYALHVAVTLSAPYLIFLIATRATFTHIAPILIVIIMLYPLALLRYGRLWARTLLRLKALPKIDLERLQSDPKVQEALSRIARKLDIENATPYLCAPPKDGHLFICFPGIASVDLRVSIHKGDAMWDFLYPEK